MEIRGATENTAYFTWEEITQILEIRQVIGGGDDTPRKTILRNMERIAQEEGLDSIKTFEYVDGDCDKPTIELLNQALEYYLDETFPNGTRVEFIIKSPGEPDYGTVESYIGESYLENCGIYLIRYDNGVEEDLGSWSFIKA